MNTDEMSCWLPPLMPFDHFTEYSASTYRCPISSLKPKADPHMSWVLISPCGIDRLVAAGPAFELFNACNKHRRPDDKLFDPYLSRFATLEGCDTLFMHLQILRYQVEGLRADPGDEAQQWAEALSRWIGTIDSSATS